MSWRDKLKNASFRGVPFKVLETDTGVGRRNIIHQYPERDTPNAEDLGPDVDEYVVVGYIVQNIYNNFDYFTERDALIAALKQKGAGKLVHPFLGEVKDVVVQGKARIRETFSEGGIARFQMTFVQAGANTFPRATIDPRQKMDDIVEDSFNKMRDEFGERYEVDSFSVGTALDDCTAAANMIKQGVLSVRTGISSVVSNALGTINTAIVNLTSTVYGACSIGEFIVDSADTFLNFIGIPNPITDALQGICTEEYQGTVTQLDGLSVPNTLGKSIVNSMTEMVRFGEDTGTTSPSIYGGMLDPITINSDSRAQESLNRLYTVNMVRNVLIVNATRVAVRINYDSYDDAKEVTDLIVDAIDDQLEKLGDEAASTDYSDYNLVLENSESFTALEQTRATFVDIMRTIGAGLANIIEWEVPATDITTLEVAYNYYEDITRNEEIFNRNIPLVRNPAFLPQGRTINILSE